MSETVRALIVIFALTLPMFWLAKKHVCQMAIDEPDFDRRRNLWLGCTAFAFLAHDFWLFMFLSGALAIFIGMRDSNRLSLYLLTLFVVPPFSADISGFGILNYLMKLDYPKLMSLVLLLPSYLTLRREPGVAPFGKTLADKCMLGFLVLPLILQGAVDTLTNTFRQGVYQFIDIFLPYYVASRGVRNLQAFRDVVMSLVIGIMLMAPMGLFEYLRKWLLYQGLAPALGIQWAMGVYLARGSDLRAMVSSGHALSLGYLMVVALGLYAYARQFIRSPKFVTLGLIVLLAGLWSPISRGPWLGALVVLAVIYATGPSPFGRTLKLLAWCTPLVVAVLASPAGEKIMAIMPFVSGPAVDPIADFNAKYRERLLDASIEVIKLNPFFGSFTYLELPLMQPLKTGEGIIDIVNSYMGVALSYGLVGLALFLGMFFCALRAVWVGYKASSPGDEFHFLGRSLLATLIGVMVTIVGVSTINTIGMINVVMIGLCLSYGDLVARYLQGRMRAGASFTAPPMSQYAQRNPSS